MSGIVFRVANAFIALVLILITGFFDASAAGDQGPREMSPDAKPIDHDRSVFSKDPSYEDKPYSPDAQVEIYGGKRGIDAPRPLFEFLRPIYREGPFGESSDTFGAKNLLSTGFHIAGDSRTAVAYNDNGDAEVGQIATRLNLELDFKLTGTERIHAFIRPLDKNGNFTRHEFSGDGEDSEVEVDGNIETLFFEGDLGSILSGINDEWSEIDLPLSFGKTPLLFQNGVWAEDAIIGGAFAIAAKSSPTLDISNMDFTFFAGFDDVNTPAVTNADGVQNDDNLDVYGLATYFETLEGYLEAGYGFIDGSGDFSEFGYHSLTAAFTKRYGGWLSNSVRGIWTFGQDADASGQTADGTILLLENSLITSKPSTYVPYMNVWAGFDRPQPLMDDTGLLKNTGIVFETDGLTGFPSLDDTGHDTYGGAIGFQYLFNLDRQIVAEVATVQIMGDDNETGRAAVSDQYGFGIRYQQPISDRLIIRADVMYGALREAEDVSGARLELRVKF